MYRTSHWNEILMFKPRFIGRRLTLLDETHRCWSFLWGTTFRGLRPGFWLEPSHNYRSRLCLWLIGFAHSDRCLVFAALASAKPADRWRESVVQRPTDLRFPLCSLLTTSRQPGETRYCLPVVQSQSERVVSVHPASTPPGPFIQSGLSGGHGRTQNSYCSKNTGLKVKSVHCS